MEISKFKKVIMFISMMSVLFMTWPHGNMSPSAQVAYREDSLQALMIAADILNK